MEQIKKVDVSILDKMIIGRVEPHIYAFSTETVPNYLKVGDTYRPLEKRLEEWRLYFPDLEKKFEGAAKVDEDTFFRDFAVHCYLENGKGKTRLVRNAIPNLPYYSKEFFKDTEVQDVKEAIADINESYIKMEDKYQFYKLDESRIPVVYTYPRKQTFKPRPNQQETIDNFKKAIEKGRTNLLMYAVMRFGKSFTSMCCATEMSAKVVVVVSAKADVKEEWKKTVESHERFADYDFLDSQALQQSDTPIKNKLDNNRKVVAFFTLQDLQGKDVKTKHKELFQTEIDLLVVDETHFGARGEKYGEVLQELNIKAKGKNTADPKEKDTYYLDDLTESVKVLKSKVRIHLSGTPYRILMGDEFKPEDIIAFCQFSDIAEEQEKWDKENLGNDDANEWDNPYYGFPEMVRFAFHPNASARKKLDELKKSGITYAFSALFRPKSIVKVDTQEHKFFYHEQEILDLLEIIDGSKSEEGMLGFLNYDKIKNGNMCRHIVCVLPFRASCDALEHLITANKEKFVNLNHYEIINIAGVDNDKLYKNTQAVKTKIKECEGKNKKTLTLTVNRMLTGSTVEEWDTMIYFKDTASPQEYDQAIFRLQNQYIKEYRTGDGNIIKYNMKPQTLLVDFDPNRMFVMQEQKSQIYNVNTDKNGNTQLEERIKAELKISPIVTVNKNKIEKVEPANILNAVREYSKDKSVVDEATAIPVDFSLLTIDSIRREIEKQGILGSKQGLKITPTEDEGTDIDVPEGENTEEEETPTATPAASSSKRDTKEDDFKKKFAMYYSRILFFAFLTKDGIISLEELISSIEKKDDNKRIAKNIDLDVNILKLIHQKINPFVQRDLDYKIQNLNTLANDTEVPPVERAEVAMKKFERLSSSEIITPQKIAHKMIDELPQGDINDKTKMLDIASKQGEFVYAVYNKYGKAVAKNFYSIPTSKAAYEFTRKVYELLGLDVSHIESNYNAYDLIKDETPMIKGNKIMINGKEIKFNTIIGNPPYQEATERTSDTPVYNYFMDVSFKISEKVTLITPGRYLFNAGKTPSEWNKKILNDKHFKVIWYKPKSTDVFANVDIKGGVAVMYRDAKQDFGEIGTYTAYSQLNGIRKKIITNNQFKSLSEIIYPQNKFNLSTLYEIYPELKAKIGSNGREKRLTTAIFSLEEIFFESTKKDNDVKIIGLVNNNRQIRYLNKSLLDASPNFDKYKIIVPKSNGSGAIGEILSTPLIGYTQSFIGIGAFDTLQEAEAAIKYVKTKFARALLGILKVTQDNSKETWANVPLQDFTSNSDIDWSQSVADIDRQLYKKYDLSEAEQQFIEEMIKPM